jgi:hypothetical protein
MVRSLLWPGATSFYQNGRILQVYLGNGHKFEQAKPCYFPINPPEIMPDVEEYGDEPEPTPLEEPVAEEAAEAGDPEDDEDDDEDEE